MTIKIGSRSSQLAMAQTTSVVECLREAHLQHSFEIVPMTTTGDRILDKTLDKIGGKGLFTKELEQGLWDGTIHLTVHSLKDMPTPTAEELPILALSQREHPFDVLVLPQGMTQLEVGKPIGTSSLRRKVQLKALFPHMEVAPVRGNVITRLEKLDRGEFSALVLAYAGLKRLGLEHRIHRTFTIEEMVPSGGQGILAIQGRKDAEITLAPFLSCIHNPQTQHIATAERSFLERVGGGCSAPIGCYGEVVNRSCQSEENLRLTAMMCHRKTEIPVVLSQEGPLEEGENLGSMLAERLKKEVGA